VDAIAHGLTELLGNPHLIALERLEHRFDQKLMTGLEAWGNVLLARIDAHEQRVLTELAVLSERLSKLLELLGQLLGNPGDPHTFAALAQGAGSTFDVTPDAELKHVDAVLKHVASDASEALAQAVPGTSFMISITFVPSRAAGGAS
jgi:hypothetical protein